jgi:superfamily II DNA or RNA helicase
MSYDYKKDKCKKYILPQLHKLAKENGVKGSKKMKKKELCDILSELDVINVEDVEEEEQPLVLKLKKKEKKEEEEEQPIILKLKKKEKKEEEQPIILKLKKKNKKLSSEQRSSQEKFEKAIVKTIKKIDNDSSKLDSKLSNLEEEDDGKLNEEELEEELEEQEEKEEELTIKQKKITDILNRLMKIKIYKKLSELISDVEKRTSLSDSDVLFIKKFISNFNKKQKYGLSCIDGSNLPVKDYQAKVIKHMLNHRGLLVFHNMGSGKTLSAVVTTQCALQMDKKLEIVVITPTSLQKNFHKELLAYGVAGQGGIKYHYYTYRTFYLKFKDMKESKMKEFFKNKFMVIDEAHILKFKPDPTETKLAYRKPKLEKLKTISPKESKVTKVFLKASRMVPKILLLSGTPILNRPADIINLIAMIDGTQPIPLEVFESTIYGKIDYENPEQVIKNKEEFDKFFKCKISFYKFQNIEDYPEVRENVIKLSMTDDIYEEYLQLQGINKTNADMSVFYNDLRQAVNNLGGVENPKLKWILKKISKGEKTIIYSNYKFTRGKNGKKLVLTDHIIDFMIKHKIPHTIITGDYSKSQREYSVNQYNSDKVGVFVISSAGSLGLDLKGTKNVIIIEPYWNKELIAQIVGRGVRYKSHTHLPVSERYVNVYNLLLVKPENKNKLDEMDSVDEILYQFSLDKQVNVDKFIKKLKKRSVEKCGENELPVEYKSEEKKDEKKVFILTNYNIPKECIEQYENIDIKKLVGSGLRGSVYKACKEDKDCKYALKIIPLNVLIPSRECDLEGNIDNCMKMSEKEFGSEVKYTKKASELEIGPKLYSSWMCDNVKSQPHKKNIKMGFLLMDRLGISLEDYIKNYTINDDIIGILAKMYNKLGKKMLKNNIYNHDLHFGNVMVDLDENYIPINMKFIDWGDTIKINKDEYNKYLEQLSYIFEEDLDYFSK